MAWFQERRSMKEYDAAIKALDEMDNLKTKKKTGKNKTVMKKTAKK